MTPGRICRIARPLGKRGGFGLACAVFIALSLTACGDEESDSSKTDTADTSQTTDKGSGDSVKLPEGFPSEVPRPEDAQLKTAQAIAGAKAWRLRYGIDLNEEGRVDKYTNRLKDAGFSVESPTEVNVTGNNGKWRVDAVIRPPTITFQVIPIG